ncbi:MAG: hypothetical protein K8W52_12600 [Deltaproteobacteria bacterium]|nr:hypothetical protein [Deltaproteobacteria bacterium]
MRTPWVAAMLALGGCNAILGIGDLTVGSDAAPGTPDAAITIDAMPNTVVGTSVVTFVGRDGATVNRNEDLTGYTIKALLPDGTTRDGVGTADGNLTIADVPAGVTYALELIRPGTLTPLYYVTSRRELELGYVTLGRPDAVSATLPTPLSINATGMQPWADSDFLWIDSFNNGTENYPVGNPSASNLPNIGDTALTATSIDWRTGYTYDVGGAPAFLVDAAKGDDLSIAHVRSVLVPDSGNHAATITTIADTLSSTSVTMTDGNTAQLNAAFAPVTVDKAQQFTLDVAQFRALAVPDGHRGDGYACYRVTNGAALYGGVIGPATWQVNGRLLPWNTDVSISGSAYGNPYPTTWGSVMDCRFTQARYFTLPTNDALVQWTLGSATSDPATAGFIASPRTRAPTDVMIGDQPFLAGGVLPLDAATPIALQWGAVVGANAYVLQIRRLYANGANALAETVAQIATADTSLSVPASLFQGGDFYQFFLTTQASAGNYAQGHLRRVAFPSGSAGVVSGVFRVSSLCGNHVKDAGEACDEGGDTATCDRDCSAPRCGDGLLNAMANEMCDDALPSNLCDVDCTPAVCGDGLFNNQAEQCDDHNLIEGDGCSAMCVLERCGNGVVDPGEICDDSNATPTDGCSELCRIEPGYSCTGAPSVCTAG